MYTGQLFWYPTTLWIQSKSLEVPMWWLFLRLLLAPYPFPNFLSVTQISQALALSSAYTRVLFLKIFQRDWLLLILRPQLKCPIFIETPSSHLTHTPVIGMWPYLFSFQALTTTIMNIMSMFLIIFLSVSPLECSLHEHGNLVLTTTQSHRSWRMIARHSPQVGIIQTRSSEISLCSHMAWANTYKQRYQLPKL